MKAGTNVWWLILWEMLPMFVFLFVRIFKHLMKAGTNVWWLIPWEMFIHVCIFICQNIQASDEGWYQCVVANSVGNVYPCLYFYLSEYSSI